MRRFVIFLITLGAVCALSDYFVIDSQCVYNFALFGIDDAAATLGAGILGAGASVFGGIMGNNANSNIAAENRAWQTEQNALDRDLSREQLAAQQAFAREQWEYNTPANQRARYEAAGINPYFALGNIQSGQAQSSLSPTAHSSSGIPQGIPMQNPLDGISASLMNTLSTLADFEIKKEEAKSLSLQNDKFMENWTIESALKKAMTSNYDWDTALKHVNQMIANNQLYRDTATNQAVISQSYSDSLLSQLKADSEEQIIFSLQLDNALKKIDLSYRPKLNDKQLEQLDADISRLKAAAVDSLASANSHNAAARMYDESANKIIQETEGIKRDNALKDAVYNYKVAIQRELMNQEKYKTERSELDTRKTRFLSGELPTTEFERKHATGNDFYNTYNKLRMMLFGR